jgi:hypothetical protein
MSVRFDDDVLAAVKKSLVIGIRAGKTRHRIIGIWAVVVERRVFVRSWTLKPDGWFEVFQQDPSGILQIAGNEFAIRAVRTRSERLKKAVDRAYAEKYHTPASQTYVRGFKAAKRRATTTELVPVPSLP